MAARPYIAVVFSKKHCLHTPCGLAKGTDPFPFSPRMHDTFYATSPAPVNKNHTIRRDLVISFFSPVLLCICSPSGAPVDFEGSYALFVSLCEPISNYIC